MSPQVKTETECDWISHLESTADIQEEKKKKKTASDIVNTELACQVKTYSKSFVRGRELSKTMQHQKPCLQTGIDEALQSVTMV